MVKAHSNPGTAQEIGFKTGWRDRGVSLRKRMGSVSKRVAAATGINLDPCSTSKHGTEAGWAVNAGQRRLGFCLRNSHSAFRCWPRRSRGHREKIQESLSARSYH